MQTLKIAKTEGPFGLGCYAVLTVTWLPTSQMTKLSQHCSEKLKSRMANVG
jgi:hypothetical protein